MSGDVEEADLLGRAAHFPRGLLLAAGLAPKRRSEIDDRYRSGRFLDVPDGAGFEDVHGTASGAYRKRHRGRTRPDYAARRLSPAALRS